MNSTKLHVSKFSWQANGTSSGAESQSFRCGVFSLGTATNERVTEVLTNIGPIRGSLYPPNLGAEQYVQFEMTNSRDHRRNARIEQNCKITGVVNALQLHISLTGKAWTLRCKKDITWIGDPSQAPTSSESDDYLLEDFGILLSTIGQNSSDQKRVFVPGRGSQSVLTWEGEYGSRETRTYTRYDIHIGDK